jgi:hypothetical protein
MKKARYLVTIITLFLTVILHGQKDGVSSGKAYINEYSDLAIREMKRSGIPASITLAQGMLESDNGNSSLARKANNHFGIKCHNDWKGETFHQDDDAKDECFRKYNRVEESFQDHSDFLMSGSRYSFLFELKPTDYRGWAKGLKKAGYATSPTYADKLISLIEVYGLDQYDQAGVSGIKKDRKKAESQTPEAAGRQVLERNRVKYIIVQKDDNFRSLQEEFDLLPFEIYKYNDLSRDQELKEGQVIYLQPKRNKAEVGNNWHTVKPGETMEDISQLYAVKPIKLYRKNLMAPGTEPKTGDKISLRKQMKGVVPVAVKAVDVQDTVKSKETKPEPVIEKEKPVQNRERDQAPEQVIKTDQKKPAAEKPKKARKIRIPKEKEENDGELRFEFDK